MKFYIFENERNCSTGKFNFLKQISVLFFVFFINFVYANKINKFTNSLYLLDFKYYHTTDVIYKLL